MREYKLPVDEFVPFFNQFQLFGFSNNMPYYDEERIKTQGSFYTNQNWIDTSYNHFREEMEIPIKEYLYEDFIDYVLNDNSIISIKNPSEFHTNLEPNTPCNRFITSLFFKERIINIIRYG